MKFAGAWGKTMKSQRNKSPWYWWNGFIDKNGVSILHVELWLEVVKQFVKFRQIFNLLKITYLIAQRFTA